MIDTRPANPFIPVSTVHSERTTGDKDGFSVVTCGYRSITGDSNKNNDVIQAKYLGTRTT